MSDKSSSAKLGRRHLKSFASGMAFKFARSAQHYAWLAHHHNIPRVTIDLLTEKIEPAAFDIERNRILARMCSHNLKQNIEQLAPPATVTAAILTAEFGIDDYCEGDNSPAVGKSVFTVTLIDDRGKEWQCTLIDERVLADE